MGIRDAAKKAQQEHSGGLQDNGYIRTSGNCIFSKCHDVPITEIPAYYIAQGGQYEQIGVAWYCHKCEALADSRAGFPSKMKKFRNCPEDLTSGMVGVAKASYDFENGWGVFFNRDQAGQLLCVGGVNDAPLF